MKPVNVKSKIYINFFIENNYKNSKFNVLDHVRISYFKNNIAKGYTPNWPEEVFLELFIKKSYKKQIKKVSG